ncbi:hypothetical protein [Caldicellulosiruptor bescii]|uniref:hypothetical protein n=1 Tax=Caldicellulosiruptor bescii TaxID=31899 RepID=UPI0012DD52B7|nr:hypothetical protein [Caldicellulosiruptor bescii]
MDGNYLFAGAMGLIMGVGLIAGACVPGINVFVAGALLYTGSWSFSLGVTSTIIGIVK